MKDLAYIREQIITLLVLMLTIAFTYNSLTSEKLQDESLTTNLTERSLFPEAVE